MSQSVVHLSIISPVYQAESIVDELVKQVTHFAKQVTTNYELILVEDGSKDQSWKAIERNCTANTQVKGIKLSRNFGQHQALTAGLAAAKGEFVMVMDCDLQDNPRYIPMLYQKIQEGYDIVFTYTDKPQHSFWRRFSSNIYHRFMTWLSGQQTFDGQVGNYTILRKKVVKEFLNISDVERQYLPLLQWLGFHHTFVQVTHTKRLTGSSTYTWKSLFKLAMVGITYQSVKLLYLPIWIGASFSIGGFIVGLVAIVRQLFFTPFSSWIYLACLLIFCTGLLLFSIGFLGVYLGKVFNQVKYRPLFVVEKKIN